MKTHLYMKTHCHLQPNIVYPEHPPPERQSPEDEEEEEEVSTCLMFCLATCFGSQIRRLVSDDLCLRRLVSQTTCVSDDKF